LQLVLHSIGPDAVKDDVDVWNSRRPQRASERLRLFGSRAERIATAAPHNRSVAMRNKRSISPGRAAGIAGIGALAVAAVYNALRARRAERETPPIGQYVGVDGVRLHYIERGEGPPLVLLHGNGATVQDLLLSGLVDAAAARFRVIVFDRPGFGHSDRPRSTIWTPAAQAKLILAALQQLDIRQPIVLGHSWGTLPALAMALDHPGKLAALVLVSGFYFPEARADIILAAGPAVPILGDLVRYTVSPLAGRAMVPRIFRTIFAPRDVPEEMASWPTDLALRPSQIRAAAADSALMLPAVAALRDRYKELELPIVIVGGERDQLVDFARHSSALHDLVPASALLAVPDAGHMVHYAAPEAIIAAVQAAVQMPAASGRTAVADELIPPVGSGSF
jgi:pimeloyl-ACP methyl ester carboxylesterase